MISAGYSRAPDHAAANVTRELSASTVTRTPPCLASLHADLTAAAMPLALIRTDTVAPSSMPLGVSPSRVIIATRYKSVAVALIATRSPSRVTSSSIPVSNGRLESVVANAPAVVRSARSLAFIIKLNILKAPLVRTGDTLPPG